MKFNFSDDTRRALAHARDESLALQHEYVGTEHILLGLCRTGIMPAFGLDAGAVRNLVTAAVRPGRAPVDKGELPYTSRAKKTLELAMAAAREMHHDVIRPEHLLLGLLREERGIGAQVLTSLGLALDGAAEVVEAAGRRSDGASLLRGEEPRRRLGRRASSERAFRIVLDDTSSSSIYEQIVDRIREGVATGLLKPGQRLQPVRRLADELDIAPGTVARAYAELERLGVVVTEGARGTRIAEPKRGGGASETRLETLTGLLRPVAVAAFHMGGTAEELRQALEAAMKGILGPAEDN